MNSNVIHRLGELQLEGLRLGAHLAEWSLSLERLASQLSQEQSVATAELEQLKASYRALHTTQPVSTGDAMDIPPIALPTTPIRGGRPYTCPHCGRVCATPAAFGGHIAAFKRKGSCIEAVVDKRRRRSSVTVGVNLCPHCKADLGHGAALSAHLRSRAKTGVCVSEEKRNNKRKRTAGYRKKKGAPRGV